MIWPWCFCNRRRDPWHCSGACRSSDPEEASCSEYNPTSIRHGPSDFGELELYDLRTKSGIESVNFFRDAIYSGSENGKILRLNIHSSQIEAGIGQATSSGSSYRPCPLFDPHQDSVPAPILVLSEYVAHYYGCTDSTAPHPGRSIHHATMPSCSLH